LDDVDKKSSWFVLHHPIEEVQNYFYLYDFFKFLMRDKFTLPRKKLTIDYFIIFP